MSIDSKKFRKAFGPVASALILGTVAAVTVAGCDGTDNPLCCSEDDFQVGGTITFEGDAEVAVALQAVADISGIAAASLDDLTGACRTMAEELDAPAADRKAAEALTDKREKMEVYCELAVAAILDFKARAGASLTVEFQPPACSASVSAKADCQGGCSASAECDVQANPPTCEGGKLEVSCKGGCTGKAGASVSCTGSCSAECSGKCTAQGGVECSGKCEGTCKGAAEGGTGEGIQADGTCSGTCEGTCEVTAPGASCEGTCEGSCSATCEGSAEASVKCDGECAGEFEPLKCEGGELKGGCEGDAKCEANCYASVKAKAECTPPSINIAFSAGGDLQIQGKLKAVLEANLGLVAALEARFSALGEAMGTVSGNINADFLAEIKVACIPVVVAALANAVLDVEGTATASVSVLGAVTGG